MKENYQRQLNGMISSEMSFDAANLKLTNYIKAQEPHDGLVSGDGSAWNDIVSYSTAPVTKCTQKRPAESSRCCVAS